jgi:hypothetical protein
LIQAQFLMSIAVQIHAGGPLIPHMPTDVFAYPQMHLTQPSQILGASGHICVLGLSHRQIMPNEQGQGKKRVHQRFSHALTDLRIYVERANLVGNLKKAGTR